MAVNRPINGNPKEEKAPQDSPFSMAEAVPIACDAVPVDNPMPSLLLILQSLAI